VFTTEQRIFIYCYVCGLVDRKDLCTRHNLLATSSREVIDLVLLYRNPLLAGSSKEGDVPYALTSICGKNTQGDPVIFTVKEVVYFLILDN